MVFTGDGSHEIREFPVPEPPDGGAVLQVEAVGLCGSDVAQHAGVHLIPGTSAFPVVPGHETVGRVWRLGRDATLGVSEGDRVAVDEVLEPATTARGLRLHDAGRRRPRPLRRVRRVHGGAAGHTVAPIARRRAGGGAHRVRADGERGQLGGDRGRPTRAHRRDRRAGAPGARGAGGRARRGRGVGDRHRCRGRRHPARRRARSGPTR